jgi:hypothetical protein
LPIKGWPVKSLRHAPRGSSPPSLLRPNAQSLRKGPADLRDCGGVRGTPRSPADPTSKNPLAFHSTSRKSIPRRANQGIPMRQKQVPFTAPRRRREKEQAPYTRQQIAPENSDLPRLLCRPPVCLQQPYVDIINKPPIYLCRQTHDIQWLRHRQGPHGCVIT